jgi:hypothetical protein
LFQRLYLFPFPSFIMPFHRSPFFLSFRPNFDFVSFVPYFFPPSFPVLLRPYGTSIVTDQSTVDGQALQYYTSA